MENGSTAGPHEQVAANSRARVPYKRAWMGIVGMGAMALGVYITLASREDSVGTGDWRFGTTSDSVWASGPLALAGLALTIGWRPAVWMVLLATAVEMIEAKIRLESLVLPFDILLPRAAVLIAGVLAALSLYRLGKPRMLRGTAAVMAVTLLAAWITLRVTPSERRLYGMWRCDASEVLQDLISAGLVRTESSTTGGGGVTILDVPWSENRSRGLAAHFQQDVLLSGLLDAIPGRRLIVKYDDLPAVVPTMNLALQGRQMWITPRGVSDPFTEAQAVTFSVGGPGWRLPRYQSQFACYGSWDKTGRNELTVVCDRDALRKPVSAQRYYATVGTDQVILTPLGPGAWRSRVCVTYRRP